MRRLSSYKNFLLTGFSTTIKPRLRRTLQGSVRYSAFVSRKDAIVYNSQDANA